MAEHLKVKLNLESIIWAVVARYLETEEQERTSDYRTLSFGQRISLQNGGGLLPTKYTIEEMEILKWLRDIFKNILYP